MNNLVVAGVNVSIADDGLFSLSDLWRCAGKQEKHKPKRWLRNATTVSLINAIENEYKFKDQNWSLEKKQSVRVVNGGNNQGVYACWELVYAYAMWISGEFFLKVIRAAHAYFSADKERVLQLENKANRLRLKLFETQADNDALNAANETLRGLSGNVHINAVVAKFGGRNTFYRSGRECGLLISSGKYRNVPFKRFNTPEKRWFVPEPFQRIAPGHYMVTPLGVNGITALFKDNGYV